METTHEIPQDVFLLESSEHFELLKDPTRLEIIELLMAPASVAELADAMQVPRTRLYHHVNLLEQVGMIRVVATRQSGVQVEKIYQAAARNFRPSKQFMRTALPRDKAQAVLKSLFGSTQADFIHAVESGAAPLEDKAVARQTHFARNLLRLTPDQLHTFILELEALIARYDTAPLPEAEASPDGKVIGVLSLVYPSSRSIP